MRFSCQLSESCRAYVRRLPTDTTSFLLAHVEDDGRVFGDCCSKSSRNPKNGLRRSLIVLLGAGLMAQRYTAQRFNSANGTSRYVAEPVGGGILQDHVASALFPPTP
jgi:hypothetical protein